MEINIDQRHDRITVFWPHHITTTGKPGLRLFMDELIPLQGLISDKTVPCIILLQRNGTA